MAGEASQSMSLKVLVEKEKNRIVFAEADKDFLDVIFSFLTIPLGTIVRLTREHFLKGDIGCLNNLYESLEKFDKELLASEHKEMLLHPLCATDVYCRSLKVLELLKCSLASRTPFSDSLLEPPFSETKPAINYGPRMTNLSEREVDTRNKDAKINLKLIVNRSNNRLLYAEVEENFVDLLCSFLSFPIGSLFKKFPHLSFKGCLGNLYKTVQDFDVNKIFQSEDTKAILLNPKLAPDTSYGNELIGIEKAVNMSYWTLCSLFKCENRVFSPKSLPKVKIGGGLVKGPSMFMVTDSLSIAPLSPISGISLINRSKVPLSHIQELEVAMGEEETLRLLVASLVSRSALTDAFLLKETKQEP